MNRVEQAPIPKKIPTLATVLFLVPALALSAFAVGGARLAAAQEEDEPDFTPGAVFGMSNDVDGNEVVAFNRDADGRLKPAGTFETGGTGTRRSA